MLLNSEEFRKTKNEVKETTEGDLAIQEICNESGIDITSLNNISNENFDKFSSNDKLKVLIEKTSLVMSKEHSDPDFKKLMYFKRKYLELKKRIKGKYLKGVQNRIGKAFKSKK